MATLPPPMTTTLPETGLLPLILASLKKSTPEITFSEFSPSTPVLRPSCAPTAR